MLTVMAFELLGSTSKWSVALLADRLAALTRHKEAYFMEIAHLRGIGFVVRVNKERQTHAFAPIVAVVEEHALCTASGSA